MALEAAPTDIPDVVCVEDDDGDGDVPDVGVTLVTALLTTAPLGIPLAV